MRWIIAIVAHFLPAMALAQEARPKPLPVDGAIDCVLHFLEKDAQAWKLGHNCVSCHQAALVVWSMREAK